MQRRDSDAVRQQKEIRAQRVCRAVLPGLEAPTKERVVRRLPVVEGLVAVRDHQHSRAEQPHAEEHSKPRAPAQPSGH